MAAEVCLFVRDKARAEIVNYREYRYILVNDILA